MFAADLFQRVGQLVSTGGAATHVVTAEQFQFGARIRAEDVTHCSFRTDLQRHSAHLRYSCSGIYSVDTGCSCPCNAARNACHARVAHFTRTGNSETPEKTASLPSASASAACCPVTTLWNSSNICSTSSVFLPFKAWVIMEAEAFEIAQPEPWNDISRI